MPEEGPEDFSRSVPGPSKITQYWGSLHLWLRGSAERRERSDPKRHLKFVLICFVLIALLTAAICKNWTDNNDRGDDGKSSRSRCFQPKSLRSEVNEICRLDIKVNPAIPTIICNGLNIEMSINDLLFNLSSIKNQGINSVEMVLTNTYFKDGGLYQNWLPLTEAHPQIKSLTVDGGNLKDIYDNSFSSMTSLEKITLIKTDLLTLNREGFAGLKGVEQFSLQQNIRLASIENGFLHELSASTVQIQNLDTNDISTFFQNLTGGAPVYTVTTLDLELSIIPNFPDNIIPQLPNLEILRIETCFIQNFTQKSFDSAQNLKQIYMENNQISTLKEDVFQDIVQNGALIYAMGNRILCDCEMEWLQQYVHEKNNSYADFENVNCSLPNDLKGQKFLNVNLCPNSPTTPSPATTTETSTDATTTTKKPPFVDGIDCSTLKKKRSKLSSIFPFTEPRFDIVEEDEISVTLNVENITFPAAFIYFDRKAVNQVSCEMINSKALEKRAIKLNTNASSDYLFCLFDSTTFQRESIQEMDCMPYRTLPIPEERPWLTEGSKAVTYAYISLAVVFALLMGAIAAFFVIRKRPTLLRGSGRVEIVKMRNREMVLVMPERMVFDSPPTPSSVYDSISGYITAPSPIPRGKGIPPPIPPIPPQWLRRNKEEHVYLEPYRHPKNMDLLLEYEWYTQRVQNEAVET